MCGLAESLRVMGLRVVTLVLDLGPRKGQLTLRKGRPQTSIEAEEVEGGVRRSAWCLLILAVSGR